MELVRSTNKADRLVEEYRMFLTNPKKHGVMDEMLETTNLGTSVCVIIIEMHAISSTCIIKYCGCFCVTDAATPELTQAINKCNLSRAYGVIEQLEKLEKSQRVFNVQLDHFGEVEPQVEEPVQDEKINEFRYVCVY